MSESWSEVGHPGVGETLEKRVAGRGQIAPAAKEEFLPQKQEA